MRTVEQRVQFLLEQLYALTDIIAYILRNNRTDGVDIFYLGRIEALREDMGSVIIDQATFDDEE